MEDTRQFAVERLRFPSSREARLVHVDGRAQPAAVIAALQVPAARPVVAVNGGTAALQAPVARRLAAMMDAVAVVAVEDGATLITGGTDVGVFALLGEALGRRAGEYVCVGVVPADLTSWPGKPPRSPPAGHEPPVQLEPHHTHFVAVSGTVWGAETPQMLALTSALSEPAASVGLLAGGGDIAAEELVAHLRAGRPVIVLEGSGRLADRVAHALRADSPKGGELAEVADHQDQIELCPVDAGAAVLRQRLRRHLRGV